MTLYFTRVFQEFARKTGRNFKSSEQARDLQSDDELIIIHDSQLPPIDDDFRGTHIVRDPRDLLVSSYFYHLRTEETWCTLPNPHNDDLPSDISYQSYLRGLDREDGLYFEMTHVAGSMIEAMAQWDYCHPHFLELRYENLIGLEKFVFRRIFEWYGYDKREVDIASRIASAHRQSRKKISLRNLFGSQHVRPYTRIGQWRDFFSPDLKREFKLRYGETLLQLGYEADNRW